MTENNTRTLHLPWNQSDPYWICVLSQDSFPEACEQDFKQFGLALKPMEKPCYVYRAERKWPFAWEDILTIIQKYNIEQEVKIAVISDLDQPSDQQIFFSCKSAQEIQDIVESLWLGDALLANRLLCFLQPIMQSESKYFGYESFARVRTIDNKVIGGQAICEASKSLNMEYAIDRYLHVQAIDTFVESNLTGFLFINFFPGFIQRPEKYMEGLSEAVKEHNIIPKYIVLDFTRSEADHDIQHLKRVTKYCRDKGFAIALDDVESVDNAQMLIKEISPDFIRLEMRLVHRIDEQEARSTMRQIVELAHANGATVIAEGVETQEMYEELKKLQVDLFQGYYFSPPVPVEEAARKTVIAANL